MLFRMRKVAMLLSVFLTLTFIAGCTRSEGGKGADTMPPTVPNGLSITAVSPSEVKVSWKPAADDRGVKEYRIYRNGTRLRTTDATSLTDTRLKPKTRYCYRVSARDAFGNESAQSTDVCAVL
ncbi:MAG: fibronectin type III domain-containing protein [Syntrophales bacterium]